MAIFNSKFSKSVEKAKVLLIDYDRKLKEAGHIRDEVADLAIEVRETGKINKFAEHIGMTQSTLSDWIQSRMKDLTLNGAIPLQDAADKDAQAARDRAKKKMDSTTTPKQAKDLYNKEKKKSKGDVRLERYIKKMDSIKEGVFGHLVAVNCSYALLLELKMFSQDIVDELEIMMASITETVENSTVPKSLQ